jgi:hypothetical protein
VVESLHTSPPASSRFGLHALPSFRTAPLTMACMSAVAAAAPPLATATATPRRATRRACAARAESRPSAEYSEANGGAEAEASSSSVSRGFSLGKQGRRTATATLAAVVGTLWATEAPPARADQAAAAGVKIVSETEGFGKKV